MMSISGLLMLLCIPLIGNGVYFLNYGKDGPSCGLICLLFFNISFLCLFLPLITRKVKVASYFKGGERLYCVWYLIIESIVAFLFIANNASNNMALVIQMILLGLFLVTVFGMTAINQATAKSLTEFDTAKSQDLLQARLNLQLALNSKVDSRQKEYIHRLIAEINSSPVYTKPQTLGIEKLISEKSSFISHESLPSDFDEISNLISQRKILLFN